ncbi:hypothetical protein GGS20DRAFT_588523 [Poronia punctata]|nr:hypothetical protein GGS20DRAFT_588523 [Poronia punctata]
MLFGENFSLRPARILPVARRIDLKRDVDLALEQAFHEQQWAAVANLARNRYKQSGDEYYRAIEVAAKSRSDNATDRTSAIEFVQRLVDDNKIVKDWETLDLYGFAVHGLLEYNKSIGVLRARLIKGFPKNLEAGLKCLECCMWNSDWENAQEVAASLNRNFPGERRLLFYNIVTMCLAAYAEDISDLKKRLFRNLAVALADRAFSIRSTGEETSGKPAFTDSEVLLWFEVRGRFSNVEETAQLLTGPNWGPIYFLEHGLQHAFTASLALLNEAGQTGEIDRIANVSLDRVVAMVEAGDSGTGVNRQYMLAFMGAEKWIQYSTCYALLGDLAKLTAFREKFEKAWSALSAVKGPSWLNATMAITRDTFLLRLTNQQAELGGKNEKVNAIKKVASEHFTPLSDLKRVRFYISQLSSDELIEFEQSLGTADAGERGERTAIQEKLRALRNKALRLGTWFMYATTRRAGEKCWYCNTEVNRAPDCVCCLRRIALSALEIFGDSIQDQDLSTEIEKENDDPLSALTSLGSICLLKIAQPGGTKWRLGDGSPLDRHDMQLYLLAVAWIEFYLNKKAKNDSLRTLLTRLYISMGCVSLALERWKPFGVKNILLASLASIIVDRLSSISPAHFLPGPSGLKNLAASITSYLETASRKRYPESIRMALLARSYLEITKLISANEKQARTCIYAIAVVEKRRGSRFKSGKCENAIQDEPLIGSLSPDSELHDDTDYSALPTWEGATSVPAQTLISYGPVPTSRRCHLSILAERFLDLVFYVQPKEFKPSKTAPLVSADWQAALSSLETLHAYMNVLIHETEPPIQRITTTPERWYFFVIMELANLVKLVLEHVLLEPSTKQTKETILKVIGMATKLVGHQTKEFINIPQGITARIQTLHSLAGLHAMGMLRETALATKNTVQYILNGLERVKTGDKTRGTKETAWLSPGLKELLAAAIHADAQMTARLKRMNETLYTAGWVDWVDSHTFGDNASVYETGNGFRQEEGKFKQQAAELLANIIPRVSREEWANNVTDSWREVLKSWHHVKFD